MILCKIGSNHVEYGKNNQDFAVEFDTPNGDVKCIVDGCSSGEHSEVGAKLFCLFFERYGGDLEFAFDKLHKIFNQPNDLLDYMLFTTLHVDKVHDTFMVNTLGDGYIIFQDHNDKITYQKLDYGPAPPYYAYNFFPKERLSGYQDGVEFERRAYTDKEFKAVGVASDGLQYILASEHKEEFERLLVARKLVQLKRFINKYSVEFKDDISIAI